MKLAKRSPSAFSDKSQVKFEKPPNFVARRTEIWDASAIRNLSNSRVKDLFGHVVVENLIERNLFGVTLLDDEDEIVAHGSFTHYPNHLQKFSRAYDSAEWEPFLRAHFEHHPQQGGARSKQQSQEQKRSSVSGSTGSMTGRAADEGGPRIDVNMATALNSMFLHLFVSRPELEAAALREAIHTLFAAVPDVHFLFLIVPIEANLPNHYRDLLIQMDLQSSVKRAPEFNLFATTRDFFVPKLFIRPAKVEDNDDLVPIFSSQSDRLEQTYGKFFVSELIEAQDENMQCFVAEAGGMAVGFMSVSKHVELDLLNRCFQLEHFHGLRKPSDADVLSGPSPQPSPTPSPGDSRPGSAAKRASKSHSAKSSEKPMSAVSRSQVSSRATPNAASRLSSAVSRKEGSGEGEASASPVLQAGDAAAPSGDEQPQVDVKLTEQAAEGDGAEETPPADENAELPEEKPHEPTPRQPVHGAPAEPRRTRRRRQFVPEYKGASNALALQLFCIDPKWETRSADLLAVVFERFPDRDYLIVTVPHMVPEFNLLQHFVRITPRLNTVFPQELYVFHRAGLLKSLRVRPANKKDQAAVERLVRALHLGDRVLVDLQTFCTAARTQEGLELQALVAECAGQVVGVAVVREALELEYLRAHYDLERFLYFEHHRAYEHARLLHFALNPVFQHFTRHFLKEVLRIGHKTSLYYRIYPESTPLEVRQQSSLATCLSELVPVPVRRQIAYPAARAAGSTAGIAEMNLPASAVTGHGRRVEPPSALYTINNKLLLEPKMAVNARVVLVGASDTSLSALETLVHCPSMKFNNLTLVTPHGLPFDGEYAEDAAAENMRVRSEHFTREHMASISLRSWVNVVYGKLTAIKREKKELVVDGRYRVPYDHLVLCTGTQYTVPRHLQSVRLEGEQQADTGRRNGRQKELFQPRAQGYARPPNVLLVNDRHDALLALSTIEQVALHASAKMPARVLVYGHTLDAYCAINQLLQLHELLDLPERTCEVTLLSPDPKAEAFGTTAAAGEVMRQLLAAGVPAHLGFELTGWTLDPQNGQVTSVQARREDGEKLALDVELILLYADKSVDLDTFRAVNDACLVFDGRLVIDAAFHTNDICVRAAGPLSKFQRRYYAEDVSHARFSSVAVGRELARSLLRLFDPTRAPDERHARELDALPLLPYYRDPIVELALLPGNVHYMNVRKPVIPLSKADAQLMQRSAGLTRELVTGSAASERGYFRLHLNQYMAVETVTCLSKEAIPVSNFKCLFGAHERLLNNLVKRFDEGLIDDFYVYFREAWALAVFHDRFVNLRAELRQLLATAAPNGTGPAVDGDRERAEEDTAAGSVEEFARRLLDEDILLTDAHRRDLREFFESRGVKSELEKRLLGFLHFHYYQLPMFARPQML